MREHDYKLTPGVYVGTDVGAADDTPYEIKMAELTAELKALFAQSNSLQEKILRELKTVGQ